MAKTYEPIATTTISGTSTTSYTFSSIPSTYTDLVFIIGSGGASGDVQPALRFNGDSGLNYGTINFSGSGSSTISTLNGSLNQMNLGYFDYLGNGTNNYACIANIMNYANSTTYKTVIHRGNNASTGVGVSVGTWRNTAAITSVTLVPANGPYYFLAGTTFTLYGIKAA